MGELDIAKIRAKFERQSQQTDENGVQSKRFEEKRVVSKFGLSPGALTTNRKRISLKKKRKTPRPDPSQSKDKVNSDEKNQKDKAIYTRNKINKPTLSNEMEQTLGSLQGKLGLSPGPLTKREKVVLDKHDPGRNLRGKFARRLSEPSIGKLDLLMLKPFTPESTTSQESQTMLRKTSPRGQAELALPVLKHPSKSKQETELNIHPVDVKERPTSKRETLVQTTIEREEQIMSALQTKSKVPHLIRRFSLVSSLPESQKEPKPVIQETSTTASESRGPQTSFESPKVTVPESVDDYSCEVENDVEHDEFLETSSIDMNMSQSSVDYPSTPGMNKKVILDFGEMEPPSPVKKMHVKVIADLEALMKKSKTKKETQKQQRMKEKMLRDLIMTAKTWGNDEDAVKKADLTIDEVSDIVTHINMCEQTNTPIRWDLINDIVFPEGIEEERDEADSNTKGSTSSKKIKGDNPSSGQAMISSKVSFNSKMEFFKKKATTASKPDVQAESKKEPVETFRQQYNLSEDEMADIMAHLTLCEDTNTPIRWDLIHRIIYPEDSFTFLRETTEADECRSAVTDVFDDNESRTSWFSIYPEFDDCASSVTFLVDGDDVKMGKKSSRKKSAFEPSFKKSGMSSVSISTLPRPQSITQRSTSEGSGLSRSSHLLRKRVHALKRSFH